MRLAAQAKLGYYRAASEAVDGILKHLRLADRRPEEMFILDPCAGEGKAIAQIGAGLGVPLGRTYAVELDKYRSQQIADTLPGINLLGPASFLGVQVTGHSFGLAYVNPPFDDELGGGRREEEAFVRKATHLLVPGGILALVCPMNTLVGNRSFVQFLDSYYHEIQVYRFPDGMSQDTGKAIRPYNEVVLFGKKRKCEIPQEAVGKHGELHHREWQWRSYIKIEDIPPLGHVQPKFWNGGNPSYDRHEGLHVWEIPHGFKPHTFKKTAFTEEELADVLAKSPLNRHLREVVIPPPKRPPLPLDKGHLGLILASGMLDGVVEGPHGPHVVRGSSMKVEFHNRELSTSEENPETGSVTTKDVFSQRMVTVIRCVGEDGTIYTHSNDAKQEEGDEALIDED